VRPTRTPQVGCRDDREESSRASVTGQTNSTAQKSIRCPETDDRKAPGISIKPGPVMTYLGEYARSTFQWAAGFFKDR
jgi:hypothetical protein